MVEEPDTGNQTGTETEAIVTDTQEKEEFTGFIIDIQYTDRAIGSWVPHQKKPQKISRYFMILGLLLSLRKTKDSISNPLEHKKKMAGLLSPHLHSPRKKSERGKYVISLLMKNGIPWKQK